MKKTIIQKIKEFIAPPVEVNVGDIGVFLDRGLYHTDSDDNYSIVSDIYYKVRAVKIYKNLIEVEVLNVNISSRTNTCIRGLADARQLKYVRPSMVLWEIKEETDERV